MIHIIFIAQICIMMVNSKLFVGGIPRDMDETEFRELFEEYGTVLADTKKPLTSILPNTHGDNLLKLLKYSLSSKIDVNYLLRMIIMSRLNPQINNWTKWLLFGTYY